MIAIFRNEVIWPLYGSTEAFWTHFQDAFQDFKDDIYDWPSEEPDLCYSQIKAEMLGAGEQTTALFLDVLMAYDGDSKSICKCATLCMSNLYLDM